MEDQAVSLFIKKAPGSVLYKGDGPKFGLVMKEPGTENLLDPQGNGIHIGLFIHHLVLVALLNAEEIYAPGEDLAELDGQHGIDLIGHHGFPKGGFDGP